MTWAIGAFIAASAGVLLAPVTQIDTTIGLLGIKALAGAIVGGFGSIPGALLGCILIGVIEPFADYYLPGIKGVSAYVVMLVVLFVRPEGLIRPDLPEEGLSHAVPVQDSTITTTSAILAKTGEKVRVAISCLPGLLLAAPLMLQDYYLAELGLMLVYAIAGIGLMILTGHTGQVSFGHAGLPRYRRLYDHSSPVCRTGVPFVHCRLLVTDC